jgi:tetraacyldisaccharide 4'-kinase
MDAAVAAAGGRVKHSTHRDLISGKKKGPLAQAALWGLSVASFFYGAAVRIRNRAFDLRLLRSHRAAVPVVSIGNLTAGGTGKTPMVAALAEWFTSRGARPVILSRGYRSLSDAANDERLVLDQLCPSVVHLQSPDRVASAAHAYRAHKAEVLLLDDGFQHRRLARDLDIVLIDALDPWGRDHLLPRGLLREPRTALKRADLVLLTRADQCADEHKKRLLNEIRAAWNGRLPVEVVFRPVGLINSAGENKPIGSIAGPVAAFCGIGNPEAFRRSLQTAGFQGRLLGPQPFEDHHHYTPSDLAALADWAQSAGASAVVTTHKDLVKIPRTDLGGLPLWALAIRAEITAGREELESQLRFFLPNAAQKKESSPGPGSGTN